jgi:hypothetical protein
LEPRNSISLVGFTESIYRTATHVARPKAFAADEHGLMNRLQQRPTTGRCGAGRDRT